MPRDRTTVVVMILFVDSDRFHCRRCVAALAMAVLESFFVKVSKFDISINLKGVQGVRNRDLSSIPNAFSLSASQGFFHYILSHC